MNIAIYTRKSVFSDKSDSTEVQYKLCKEYAGNNYDVTSVVEYDDEGYTGANINRPGFASLMKDIEDKKVDALICYKIDRISRNVMDFSNTFNTLQENNVAFVSVKEQIDTSTPLGRAMMYICSVFAQMERETIAERVKDGMIELAKSGKWAGGRAPLGYKRERCTVNGKQHTMLVANEEEMSLLNLIFDTFTEVGSLNGLETYFRQNKIRSMKGTFLSTTQLYQLLRNPHYCAATVDAYRFFENKGCLMATDIEKFDGKHGLVAYGRTTGGRKKKHILNTPDKWIISVGLHEPIFSSDKWLSVQKRFGLNKIDRTNKYEIGLLKGIVRCKCGRLMRVQHKINPNSTHDYYFCQTKNVKGPEYCDTKMIAISNFDDILLSTFNKIVMDKELIYKYFKDNKPKKIINERRIIEKEIILIENKIKKITNTLCENSESTAAKYLIEEIEKLDKKLAGLNFELREVNVIKKESQSIEYTVDEIYNKICEFMKCFDRWSYSDKNTSLKNIIKKCIWDGINLDIEF